jgi:hypothetical protein
MGVVLLRWEVCDVGLMRGCDLAGCLVGLDDFLRSQSSSLPRWSVLSDGRFDFGGVLKSDTAFQNGILWIYVTRSHTIFRHTQSVF